MSSRIQAPSVIHVNQYGRPQLSDTCWDDFVVIGASLKDIGARVPTWGALFGTTVFAWHFTWNAGLAEELHFEIQLPHTWVPGTVIFPHVHIGLPAAGAGIALENAQWDLDYFFADVGSAFPAGVTTVTSTVADLQNEPVRQHLLHYVPAAGIDLAGCVESCVVKGRIRRLPSLGNDYQHSLALLSMDAHIQINSMGTDTADPPFEK